MRLYRFVGQLLESQKIQDLSDGNDLESLVFSQDSSLSWGEVKVFYMEIVEKELLKIKERVDNFCSEYEIQQTNRISNKKRGEALLKFVIENPLELLSLKFSVRTRKSEDDEKIVMLCSDERYSQRDYLVTDACGIGVVLDTREYKFLSFNSRFKSYPILTNPDRCPDQHKLIDWSSVNAFTVIPDGKHFIIFNIDFNSLKRMLCEFVPPPRRVVYCNRKLCFGKERAYSRKDKFE